MTGAIARRWASLRAAAGRVGQVLGMNQRNLWCIYPNNPRQDFPLADNKILTKEVMAAAGVPVPRTYRIYRHFFEMRHLEEDLGPYAEFVVKPARGSGGGGVVVVVGREAGAWVGIGGKRFRASDLRKHLADIVFGVYSFDLQDEALVEERIRQHPEMERLSPFGLADVRVILHRDRPVMAMTRLPTRRSEGRANLHRGAVGVGIDLVTGRTVHAEVRRRPLPRHPDTGVDLVGVPIPCWEEVLETSRTASAALPLKYLGADVCVSESGAVLLEVNVRPGLEIQNANLAGLRTRLAQEPPRGDG